MHNNTITNSNNNDATATANGSINWVKLAALATERWETKRFDIGSRITHAQNNSSGLLLPYYQKRITNEAVAAAAVGEALIRTREANTLVEYSDGSDTVREGKIHEQKMITDIRFNFSNDCGKVRKIDTG